VKKCKHDFCEVSEDTRCCKDCHDRDICDDVCEDYDGYCDDAELREFISSFPATMQIGTRALGE
jgi:hypothetical protein